MKLWGGRFQKATDSLTDDFNSSIRFDQRMYEEDICGSIAHAKMLGKQGIIPKEDSDKIVSALAGILQDIKDGKVEFSVEAEDIHMNIETILTERIGDAGKRLHTGRSRNDQVALDIRLYLRREQGEISALLTALEETLLTLAEQNIDTIMPGYTHLQRAQPVTLAHYLMAYFEMFLRDLSRLSDWRKRMNVMPLGSGALAATTYPLDRSFVAEELGFDAITRNSLDGVSDRDFVLELAFCLSEIMMHLSRFSEEIILWNSHEFSFVEMDDAYSTGSSIMPQKKNPDIAELVRGKCGRVYGDLTSLLVTMKSLPLAYNKDMQEDKEPIFDAVDTVKMCLPIFNAMISAMKVKKQNMLSAAKGGFTNATDVADYLVRKGLPFRDAHAVVGKMVSYALSHNKDLDQFTMNEFKDCCELFDSDIYEAISMETCVNARSIPGGPAKEQVLSAIAEAKQNLKQYQAAYKGDEHHGN